MTAELAEDVARIAAKLAETATTLAAQREANAQLLPDRADELVAKARNANEFAEHERREADRWARVAEETSQQTNSDPAPGASRRSLPD